MGRKNKGGRPELKGSRDQRNLDSYLAEKQLQRKFIAKDGSCLFRAVSEQVYSTQCYHQRVRMECVSYIRAHQEDFQNFFTEPFEAYLGRLARELWGGEVELVALSNMYTRTIVLYMCNEQNDGMHHQIVFPNDVEQVSLKELVNPIQLAYSDGNHYDSVYSSQYMHNMGFCQGIVYRLLFEKVLEDQIPPQCKKRLNTLSEEDLSQIRKGTVLQQQSPQYDKSLVLLERHYNFDSLRAMSYKMHHNAALKVHQKERDSIEKYDRHVAASIQFQVGDRCRFCLPGGKAQDGEIIALNGSRGCHSVYVYEANEQWEIPSKDISLKYSNPYNGRRNPSQPNSQNRSRSRHTGPFSQSSTEISYSRRDDHANPSSDTPLQPPSANPEAWPTPTPQGQIHPVKQNIEMKNTTGATKQVPSTQAQTQPRKHSDRDKKGSREDDKKQTQKVVVTPSSIPPSVRTTQGNAPSTQAVSKGPPTPHTQNIQTFVPVSTAMKSNNAHTPFIANVKQSTSGPANRMPAQNSPAPSILKPGSSALSGSKINTSTSAKPNQPVSAKKVDGGPGGSLTSEDSNYSGSSSSDESTEKVDKGNPKPASVLASLFPNWEMKGGQANGQTLASSNPSQLPPPAESRQSNKLPPQAESRQGNKLPPQAESRQGNKLPPQAESRQGNKLPPQAESRQGNKLPPPAESRQGNKLPPQAESRQGIKLPPQSESRQGNKLPPQAESRQGIKLTPQAESRQGNKLTPQAESRQGNKLPPQAESRQGNKLPPQAESRQGNKLPPQAESRQGNTLPRPTPQVEGTRPNTSGSAELKYSAQGGWKDSTPVTMTASQANKKSFPPSTVNNNPSSVLQQRPLLVHPTDILSRVPPTQIIRTIPTANANPTNAMSNFGNGFPVERHYVSGHASAQRVDRGRESPYLDPQIPPDPSSQPEEAWPNIDSNQSNYLDPASSTLLAAMGTRRANISGDPSVVSVSMPAAPTMTQSTPVTGTQLPVTFGQFSPPAFQLQAHGDHGSVNKGQSITRITSSTAVPLGSILRGGVSSSPGLMDTATPRMFTFGHHPMAMNTSPSYHNYLSRPTTQPLIPGLITSSPNGANESRFLKEQGSFQPQSRTESHMPTLKEQSNPASTKRVSRGNPIQQSYVNTPVQGTKLPEKMFSPGVPKNIPPESVVNQPPQIALRPTVLMKVISTQTPAPPTPPKLVDNFSQVEPSSEFLSVTTYTQTNNPTLKDAFANAVVEIEEVATQTNPDVKSTESQTTDKYVPLLELEPLSLDEGSTTPDKIKFAIEYSIKCLEACSREEDSDTLNNVLQELKDFQENDLTSFLDRPSPVLQPLDSSQQDFLQSFAGREYIASQLQQFSQQQPSFMFNRVGSGDKLRGNLDQRDMMELLRQQENEKASRSELVHPDGHLSNGEQFLRPQAGATINNLTAEEEEEAAKFKAEHQHQDQRPIAPSQRIPPHYPMAHHPLMMQRPPMMMMPPFFYPFPGFTVPPYQMVPPHIVPPNVMGSAPSPQSPVPESPRSPSNQDLEEDKKNEDVFEAAIPGSIHSVVEGVVPSHQETGYTSSISVSAQPRLVAPSAFTVPSSIYQQGDVVSSPSRVEAPESSFHQNESVSSGVSVSTDAMNDVAKQADVMPPTPFESKNPYDTIPVAENITSEKATGNGISYPAKRDDEVVKTPSSLSPRPDESTISRQRLPCRGKQNGPAENKQQRYPKSNNHRSRNRQNPRGGQDREGQSTTKPKPQEPQLTTDSQKLAKVEESTKSPKESASLAPTDSSKASSSKTSYKSSRPPHPKNKGGGGGKGQTRQQQHQRGTPAHSSQSQGHGSRSSHKGGKRQGDSSSQTSSNGGRGTQDPTRGPLFDTHEQQFESHPGIPCSAFQPRSFCGGFPSPSHPPANTYEPEGEYSLAQNLADEGPNESKRRWKFRDLSQEDSTVRNRALVKVDRDLLNWDAKDRWQMDDTFAAYTETVEDPFLTFPNSQPFWASDVGDFMSLSVDGLAGVDPSVQRDLFQAPTAATTISPMRPVDCVYRDEGHVLNSRVQCFTESKPGYGPNQFDSECVIEQNFSVKLPN